MRTVIITGANSGLGFETAKKIAKNYNEKVYGKVYALLLNAGISGMHEGITEDGMDIIFQTNHLGHFLLANLMLPHMEDGGKIFSTTSDMHDLLWER